MRIIVVDDADDVRELICTVLETKSGGLFEVVGTAADGQAGVDLARREVPDLVVLDIAMPVMDGMQALPHIRAAAPEAVVAMVSGYPADVGAPQALAAGAHGYVEKSRLVRTLVPQLRAIIDAAGRGGTDASPARSGG